MAQNSLVAFGDLGGILRSVWGSLIYLLGSQRKREWEVPPRIPKLLGHWLGIWNASSALSAPISEGNPVGRVSHSDGLLWFNCWSSWKQLSSFSLTTGTHLNGKLKIPVDFPEFSWCSEVCLSTTWQVFVGETFKLLPNIPKTEPLNGTQRSSVVGAESLADYNDMLSKLLGTFWACINALLLYLK